MSILNIFLFKGWGWEVVNLIFFLLYLLFIISWRISQLNQVTIPAANITGSFSPPSTLTLSVSSLQELTNYI